MLFMMSKNRANGFQRGADLREMCSVNQRSTYRNRKTYLAAGAANDAPHLLSPRHCHVESKYFQSRSKLTPRAYFIKQDAANSGSVAGKNRSQCDTQE